MTGGHVERSWFESRSRMWLHCGKVCVYVRVCVCICAVWGNVFKCSSFLRAFSHLPRLVIELWYIFPIDAVHSGRCETRNHIRLRTKSTWLTPLRGGCLLKSGAVCPWCECNPNSICPTTRRHSAGLSTFSCNQVHTVYLLYLLSKKSECSHSLLWCFWFANELMKQEHMNYSYKYSFFSAALPFYQWKKIHFSYLSTHHLINYSTLLSPCTLCSFACSFFCV